MSPSGIRFYDVRCVRATATHVDIDNGVVESAGTSFSDISLVRVLGEGFDLPAYLRGRGKPVKITTSTGEKTHVFGLMIDVAKNEPRIVSHTKEENPDKWHGVEIEMDVGGRYTKGAQSIPEYIKQTAIANPYAKITYKGPNGKVTFSRTVKDLPVIPKEIKPHPYGVELGVLERMLCCLCQRSFVHSVPP
jgi:DNA topoisomerase VI B subunit